MNAEQNESKWYYAKAGKSIGPLSEDLVNSMIEAGEITPDTNMWKSGIGVWTPACQTEFASLFPQNKITEKNEPEWYYAKGNKSIGPIAENVLKKMIDAGVITPDTKVHKSGGGDWMPASQTGFNSMFSSSAVKTIKKEKRNSLPMLSMIFGIASLPLTLFCVGPFIGITAIILGVLDIVHVKSTTGHSIGLGKSYIGIISGVSSIILAIILFGIGVITSNGSEGKRAKQVWDQMKNVDLYLETYNGEDKIAGLNEAIRQYGYINIDGVDLEIKNLIIDKKSLLIEVRNLTQSFINEVSQLQQSVNDVTEFGGLLGSTDYDDPQGTALAGALLFNLIGNIGASDELENIQNKYSPLFDELKNKFDSLDESQKQVANYLNGKYSYDFN